MKVGISDFVTLSVFVREYSVTEENFSDTQHAGEDFPLLFHQDWVIVLNGGFPPLNVKRIFFFINLKIVFVLFCFLCKLVDIDGSCRIFLHPAVNNNFWC